ncbi:Zinc finger protein 28 [Folsomia candida]|uniref:Zinc finger protein 28 n=1 Tax=Folsomia candida TaxID=158441 RepID=A0A226DDG2_FOLCA|nr:Zinc finger protein 28 [Folsomia candida]
MECPKGSLSPPTVKSPKKHGPESREASHFLRTRNSSIVAIAMSTLSLSVLMLRSGLFEENAELLDLNPVRFPCALCGWQSKCRADHLRHVTTHTAEEPYACQICGARFRQSTCLRRHERIHKRKPEEANVTVNCEICGKTIKNTRQRYHFLAFHNGRPKQKCVICHREFIRPSELRRHIESVHSTKERPRFPCGFSGCGKTYLDKKQVLNQFRMEHVPNPVRFKCTFCRNVFKTRSDLERHIGTHTTERPYPCQTCGSRCTSHTTLRAHEGKLKSPKPYKKSPARPKPYWKKPDPPGPTGISWAKNPARPKPYRRTHLERSIRTTFRCQFCPSTFLHNSTKWKHVKASHENRRYPCNICDKVYMASNDLKRHVISKHSNMSSPPNSCGKCEYKSWSKHELTVHVRRVHDGVKNCECYFCGKRFFRFAQLVEHSRRIHTLEK